MATVSPPVHIVLATYNGARHLPSQLESLQAQTCAGWRLLARDDGSTDDTPRVLDEFAARDHRARVVGDDRDRLGTSASFSRLAALALEEGATRVMFADQDDVWHRDKIERALRLMDQSEQRLGSTEPLLVHTDLEVIDEAGRIIHPSFMRLQRLRHPNRDVPRTLLVQNVVTGCTAMANRALLSIALPVADDAVMHDWWLALCAAACGTIVYDATPTVGYRRHGTNLVAVRGFWRTMNPFRTNWRRLWREGTPVYGQSVRQVEALLDRLEGRAAKPEAVRLMRRFLDLHRHRLGVAGRLRGALALGLESQTWPRTAVLYARLACWRGTDG